MGRKSFTIYADTIIGDASNPESGGPVIKVGDVYESEKCTRIAGEIAGWLSDRQIDVIFGGNENGPDAAAFNEDGNLRVKMTVSFDEAKETAFIEVTNEGFYVYSSAELIDAGDRVKADFFQDPTTVVDLFLPEELKSSNKTFEDDVSFADAVANLSNDEPSL